MAKTNLPATRAEYYFRQAIWQNSPITLVPSSPNVGLPFEKAACVDIQESCFLIEPPLLLAEDLPTPGAVFNGAFAVKAVDVERCRFRCHYDHVEDNGGLLLAFTMPGAIYHQQTRQSLRCDITPAQTQGFSLWHCSQAEFENVPPQRQNWRLIDVRDWVLADLSASGMRVDILEKGGLFIHLSDYLMLRGIFGVREKPENLWVAARVVRKARSRGMEGAASAGCHFTRWRKAEDIGGRNWFKADPTEGIGAIGRWLARNFQERGQRAHNRK